MREDRPRREVEARVEHPDEVGDEHRERVVDAGDHADLAQQVEPAGEPGPLRSVRPGQLRGPVVEATGRRVRRADLTHRHADEQREEPDDDPPEGDDDRPTRDHAEPVAGEPAGEDGDDREGDGEVREPPHPPVELLRVAQVVQDVPVGLAGRALLAVACPLRSSPRVPLRDRHASGARCSTSRGHDQPPPRRRYHPAPSGRPGRGTAHGRTHRGRSG